MDKNNKRLPILSILVVTFIMLKDVNTLAAYFILAVAWLLGVWIGILYIMEGLGYDTKSIVSKDKKNKQGR